VLVVDDDRRMRHLLEVILRNAGYTVALADDGDAVPGMVERVRPDVIVLDLMMPRVSGLEALRALRAAGEEVAILVLTAAGEDAMLVEALDTGADDYVLKPFVARVLLARLRALARRTRSAVRDLNDSESVADVVLDPATHEASVSGRRVALSPTEYSLLRTLMRGAGQVFSSDELLSRVWGPSYVGEDEILRANIYRLRRKLEPEPGSRQYIRGRRGVGYFFSPDG
jgi:DNA-binding response OmpR family regulator